MEPKGKSENWIEKTSETQSVNKTKILYEPTSFYFGFAHKPHSSSAD